MAQITEILKAVSEIPPIIAFTVTACAAFGLAAYAIYAVLSAQKNRQN